MMQNAWSCSRLFVKMQAPNKQSACVLSVLRPQKLLELRVDKGCFVDE